MQTPDKRKQMFLDMQEHPEKYSEEQIEAMMDDLDRLPDVDAAWQKFQQAEQTSSRSSWFKAAASIIGILMLSGIAYAAVHIISHSAGVDAKTMQLARRSRLTASHRRVSSRIYRSTRW